jgi:hypothetical protein
MDLVSDSLVPKVKVNKAGNDYSDGELWTKECSYNFYGPEAFLTPYRSLSISKLFCKDGGGGGYGGIRYEFTTYFWGEGRERYVLNS